MDDITVRAIPGIEAVKKTRYWTPDGRVILTPSSMREFIKKKDGKVIESGWRDSNLDRGWLLQPPIDPKPRCFHCDKWHDTQEEIDACGVKKRKFDAKYAKIAARGQKGNDSDLRAEIDELKGMLAKLLEAK